MKRLMGLVLIIVLSLFAACSGSKETAELKTTKWQLYELNGSKITTERAVTIEFTEDNISGNGVCNTYGGSYTQTGSVIKFGNIYSTEMACGDLETETAYFKALNLTESFKIKSSKLYLYSGGKVTMVFVKGK